MSVLGAAEQSETDLVTLEITVPRPRLLVPAPAPGGQPGPAAARKRRAGGTHSPAPGDRELRVRQVQVREVHVREVRAGERQEHEHGTREVRTREVRSLAVHAREPGSRETRGRRASSPGSAVPGSGRAGGVRLTRRGRVVLAAFAGVVSTAMVTLFWLSVAGGAQAASHGLRPGAAYQGMTQVVVRPGQTLWSIASRAEPAADPRLVIQQIIQVNGLNGSVIQPGESLWVPKG